MQAATSSTVRTAIQLNIREAKLARRALQRTCPKYLEGTGVGEFTTGKFRALANRIDALLGRTTAETTFFHVSLREAKLVRRALRQAARVSGFTAVYAAVANRVDELCAVKQEMLTA